MIEPVSKYQGLIEVFLRLWGFCRDRVVMIAQIVEERRATFADFTWFCLCSGVDNERERGRDRADNPRKRSSHTYSLHVGSLRKKFDYSISRTHSLTRSVEQTISGTSY
jgi:hypothetical protein